MGMKRYGGSASVTIHGVNPDDVMRHIKDLHPDGDIMEYEENPEEGTLTMKLGQGGNTGALGALTSILDELDEALDPCTSVGTIRFTAQADPVEDDWGPKR